MTLFCKCVMDDVDVDMDIVSLMLSLQTDSGLFINNACNEIIIIVSGDSRG